MTVREFFEKAEENDFADYEFIWHGGYGVSIGGFFVSHAEKKVYVW